MDTSQIPQQIDDSASGWDKALYAFLAEKERRSGSKRTVEGYARMLRHFFGGAGRRPDRVTSADVFAWAYAPGLSGKQPSQVTIGARIACLSSFYRFLIRMDAVQSNPCDALERPKVQLAPPKASFTPSTKVPFQFERFEDVLDDLSANTSDHCPVKVWF
jgi:site-specific recombinase XerD